MTKRINEKFTWESKDKLVYTAEETVEIKDTTNKTSGTSIKNYNIVSNVDDLEQGIKSLTKTLNKTKSEIDTKEDEMKSMGKKPILSNELVKLRKQLQDLAKYNAFEKLEGEVKGLQESFVENKTALDIRIKALNDRPE